MQTVPYSLPSAADTARLGEAIARHLQAGDVVGLSGPLGAGKTTLARGIIRAFAGTEDAPSPTYTLVETYAGPGFDLWHFDLYRLAKAEDVYEIGYEAALEGASLIEWPERIAGLLPEDLILVRLEIVDDGRQAHIEGPRDWIARLGPESPQRD